MAKTARERKLARMRKYLADGDGRAAAKTSTNYLSGTTKKGVIISDIDRGGWSFIDEPPGRGPLAVPPPKTENSLPTVEDFL